MKTSRLSAVIVMGMAFLGWSARADQGVVLPAAPMDPGASVKTQLTPAELSHFMELAKMLILANGNPPKTESPALSVDRYNLRIDGHYQEDGSFRLLKIILTKKAKFMDTIKSDFADSQFEIDSDGKIALYNGEMALLQNPEVQAILQKHIAVWMNVDPETIRPSD